MQNRTAIAGLLGAAALIAASHGPADSAGSDKGVLVTAAGSPYAVGTTPTTVVTADLDNDGDLDVATANINGSTITVLRNNGAGSFTSASYAAGHPADLAVANLNGDAYPDLIATRSEPNCCGNTDTMLTLLGTGNAAFGAATALSSVGFNVGPLAVGDVNGDNIPDAITTNTWFGAPDSQVHQEFTVRFGNGSGGWVSAPAVYDPDVATDSTPLSDSVLVDVDGDGDRDLVFADTRAGRVTVWKNNGVGTFARTGVVPLARQTGDIVPSDFDHDGDIDLAVSGSNSGAIVLLLNGGTGAFTSAAWSPIGTGTLGPNSMTGSDVNDDGNVDLIGGGINQDSFSVFLGDGTGHFTVGWGSPYSVANPKSVAGGDLDGDGFGDVVVASNSTDTAHVRLTRIDNDAPSTSLVVDPATPSSTWHTGQVSAAVLGTDGGSGIAEVRCSKDPSTAPASFAVMPSCPGSFSISGEGVHHVYGAARDRAGNTSTVVDSVVRIDTQPPALTLQTSTNPQAGWFTSQPTILTSASDPTSGLAGLRCVLDPPSAPLTYDALSGCSTPFPALSDGVHHVYAAARDVAGNTTPVSHLQVAVDTAAPALQVSVSPATVVRGNPVTVTPTASDAASGIDHVDCDPAPTDVVGENLSVQCVAYDIAGNSNQQLGTYDVTPADVSAQLSSAKAAGARLAVTTQLGTDGLVDSATVTVVVPSSLRVDVVPTGCSKSSTGMTCAPGPLDPGDAPSLTMLVSPRTPGPHTVTAHVNVPDDPVPGDNDDATAITVSTVCDNSPTGGADIIVGSSSSDILCGLSGNDTFRGLSGNDLIFGGTGSDTLSYSGSPSPMAVDLRLQGLGLIGARPRSGTGHGQDSFTGIENIIGSSFADLLTGNGLSNRLVGGLGTDILRGVDGVDRLEGGGGADSLTGGTGRDLLLGGAGTDTCRESTDTQYSCERR